MTWEPKPNKKTHIFGSVSVLLFDHDHLAVAWYGCTPPPLYKLRQSPKLIRSLRLLSLGHGRSLRATHTATNTGHPGSKREECMGSWCRKGHAMHKHPQNQSYLGSSGQTLTTNVSMTLCDSQIRHQTHVLCGCTMFGTESKLGTKLIRSLRLL